MLDIDLGEFHLFMVHSFRTVRPEKLSRLLMNS
jgi:hypothetical protein